MNGRRALCSAVVLLALGGPVVADEPAADKTEDRPTVKLTPKVQVVPRDRAYFQTLPCDKLEEQQLENEQQGKWLEERRRVCLQKLKPFVR